MLGVRIPPDAPTKDSAVQLIIYFKRGFMKQKQQTILFFLSLILFTVLVGFGPILTIFSMNALFGLSIAVSFWNWLAVFWLSMIGVGIVRAGTRLGINSSIFSLFNKE